MQIFEIRDPVLFQRLVRKLMIADRGSAYQVVDDAGGDGGLHGFDPATGDLHAIYCPTKPERAEVERGRIERKFRSDLKKAVQLRDEKGYEIRTFVFVTPVPLREPLQRAIRDEARAVGFQDGQCLSGEALEVLLGKHQYLLEQFAELAFPRVESRLIAIREILESRQSPLPSVGDMPTIERPVEEPRRPPQRFIFEGVRNPALADIEERLAQGDSDAVYQLAIIRAEASDPAVRIAADLIEQGHWYSKHQLDRVEAVCRRGAALAQKANLSAAEAVLRAMLARVLAVRGSCIDLARTTDLEASRRVGMQLYDSNELASDLKRIRDLYSEVDRELNEALRCARISQNIEATYWTFAAVATVEAYMLTPRLMLARIGDVKQIAEIELARQRVRATLEAAIRVAAVNGPSATVLAYSNAANDLRLAGDCLQAHHFARRALEIASEYGIEDAQAQRVFEVLEYERLNGEWGGVEDQPTEGEG